MCISIHYWAKKKTPLFASLYLPTHNTYSYATINLTVTIGTSARAIGVGKYNTRVYVEALRADTDRCIGTSQVYIPVRLLYSHGREDTARVHVIRLAAGRARRRFLSLVVQTLVSIYPRSRGLTFGVTFFDHERATIGHNSIRTHNIIIMCTPHTRGLRKRFKIIRVVYAYNNIRSKERKKKKIYLYVWI